MDLFLLAAGVGLIVVIGGGIFILKKTKKGQPTSEISETEEYEIIEDEPLPFQIEETEEKECPPEVKKKLLENQQKIFKDAHKIYLVITNALRRKEIPPVLKKELDTFIRSYNRLREMEEEINVYPFSDCEKVFKLKFEFYSKLIRETAQKIMVMAKRI
jgi:hypothetical protein